MARNRAQPARPVPQLVVAVHPGPGAGEDLRLALAAAPVAVVRLVPKAEQGLSAGECKSLVAMGQAAGAAVLITDDAHLARVLKADGVMLSWQGHRGVGGLEPADFSDGEPMDGQPHERALDDMVARVEEARSVLGGQAIVGVVAANTRDSAMRLGEGAIDFLAFDHSEEQERLAFVGWWAEVFEIPCVALGVYRNVGDEMGAAVFAHAGADFVEIGPGLSGDVLRQGVSDVADAVGVVDA